MAVQMLAILASRFLRFSTLTHEEAFDLACHDNTVLETILPHEFQHKFSKIDDFEATLDFRLQQTPELIAERKQRMLKRKAEKMRRKELREQQTRARRALEGRKIVEKS